MTDCQKAELGFDSFFLITIIDSPIVGFLSPLIAATAGVPGRQQQEEKQQQQVCQQQQIPLQQLGPK
jgi:hypothetical protein